MKPNTHNPDINLICKNGNIPTHKTILILNSDYFDTYFSWTSSNDKDSITGQCPANRVCINMSDYDTNVVQLVINYLYNIQSYVNYTDFEYRKAIELCDRYLLVDIMKKIEIKYHFIYTGRIDWTLSNNIGRCPDSDDIMVDDYHYLTQSPNYIDANDFWIPSSFTERDGRIRKSLIYRPQNIFIPKGLFPTDDWDDEKLDYDNAIILKYSSGSFFSEHTDVPKTKYFHGNNHVEKKESIGKLLFIFYSPDAEGGDLILGDEVVVSSKIQGCEKWIPFEMPLYTKHQVSLLESGIRYCVSIPIMGNIEYEYDLGGGNGWNDED